jgi:hypothetical protein
MDVRDVIGSFSRPITTQQRQAVVKTHIPHDMYPFDYRSFFIRASVASAIGVIVYSTLFGTNW